MSDLTDFDILADKASKHLVLKAVAANTLDTITVASWGDPLWLKGGTFDHSSRGIGEPQGRVFDDNFEKVGQR